MNLGLFGLVEIEVHSDQVRVFHPVGRRLQDVSIAKSRLVSDAVAQPPHHFVVEVIADGNAVELKIDQSARGSPSARFVVAVVQRVTIRRRPPSDGDIQGRAADMVPGEISALHPEQVGVRDPGGGAVDVHRGGLSIENLDAGGIAKGLVHAQARGDAQIVVDLRIEIEAQPVGVEDAGVVAVAAHVGRGLQHAEKLLLHGRRELCHGRLQLREGQVVGEVLVGGIVLRHVVIDGGNAGGKRSRVGVDVEKALDHQVLQLHAVIVRGHVPPNGVSFETVVAGEVDPVQGPAPLGKINAVIEVFHLSCQFSRGRLVAGQRLFCFFFLFLGGLFLRRQSLLKGRDRFLHLLQFLAELGVLVTSGRCRLGRGCSRDVLGRCCGEQQ